MLSVRLGVIVVVILFEFDFHIILKENGEQPMSRNMRKGEFNQ